MSVEIATSEAVPMLRIGATLFKFEIHIDISIFVNASKGIMRGGALGKKLKPLDQLKSKKRDTKVLRRRLTRSERLEICEWCRCECMNLRDGIWYWNDKALTLQIDHIHGRKVEDSDGLWNLRFLCPNCHAQTYNHTNNTPTSSTDKRLTPCQRLRRKLNDSGREYKCEMCECKDMTKENEGWLWRDWPIKLEMDHIDGNRSNNDVSNLRWICSSCHTQTPTHSGRNIKRTHVS